MKISVYVRNKDLSPSGYYRVVQYMNKLSYETIIHSIVPDWMFSYSLKITKRPFISKAWAIFYYLYILINTYRAMCVDKQLGIDCVIVSKTFIPRYCPHFFIKYIESFLERRKLIWDFDDFIFGNSLPQNEAGMLIKKSEIIIVTHEHLKKALPEQCQNKVIILPTTDGDLKANKEIMEERLKSFNQEIKILWLATASNLPNLDLAIRGLDMAAEGLSREGKCLKLIVVCNLPFYAETNKLAIENITWNKKEAICQTYRCHIGIMPLKDNEFNRGKGAFKLIQYLATGMPVIASAVGYNRYVVNEKIGFQISTENRPEEWANAIYKLTQNMQEWRTYSENSYAEWVEKFSYEKNLSAWKDIIESIQKY